MNMTLKLGIAAALSLGAAAANATVASNSTGSSTAILFAEVVNGSTAVASYAENTGVSISSAFAGTNATIAADANLSALFAADVSGDTLLWGVEGGQYTGSNTVTFQKVAGATQNVSTAVNPTQITTKTSSSLPYQNTDLSNTITALNANLGAGQSVEGASPSSAGIWDVTSSGNISNWASNGPASQITGPATVALYSMTGTGTTTSKLQTVTNGTVTFSSAGLVFSPGSTTPPVPLPPAVWLLGSGLLGLAGVARRKSIKA